MARYPGAVWKPLSTRFSGNKRMAAHNRMNLHVAVSEASSLHGFFNQPYRASSHFYVRKSGVVEQYVDTAYQAEADGDGNDATISVETQGGLRNPQGEPWTDAQVEALAKLFAWAVKTHGIPARLAESSHVGSRSKGLSWHRLGIDGNFPSSGILAGRSQRGGGMHYSKSLGKICPGDTKIRQIPGILARAKAVLNGRGQSASRDDDRTPVRIVKQPTGLKSFIRTTRDGFRMRVLNLKTAHKKAVRNRRRAVKKLQGLLLAKGHGPGGLVNRKGRPDGVAGAGTRRELGEFQRRTNTGDGKGNADYIVGKGTWDALVEK